MTDEQSGKLASKGVQVIETEIEHTQHIDGKLEQLVFKDGTKLPLKVLYAKVDFVQNSEIPSNLEIELTELGHIKVDPMQKTNVKGVYACGDNMTPFRSVSFAVSTGTIAGAMCNKELIDEEF